MSTCTGLASAPATRSGCKHGAIQAVQRLLVSPPINVMQNIYTTGSVTQSPVVWQSHEWLWYSVPEGVQVSMEMRMLFKSFNMPKIVWLEVAACVHQDAGHGVEEWKSILEVCSIPERHWQELLSVMHLDSAK